MANIESVAGSATPFRARAANRSSTQASAAIAPTTTSFGRRVALAAAVASGTQTNAEAAEHSEPAQEPSERRRRVRASRAAPEQRLLREDERDVHAGGQRGRAHDARVEAHVAAFLMQRFQQPCCLCSGFGYGCCCGVAHSLQPSDQVWKGSDESSNETISGSTIGGFQGS